MFLYPNQLDRAPAEFGKTGMLSSTITGVDSRTLGRFLNFFGGYLSRTFHREPDISIQTFILHSILGMAVATTQSGRMG